MVAALSGIMSTMTQHWEHLGARLRDARDALGMTQQDIARRIGVERNTLRLIEGGQKKRVTPTIRAYAKEVGWTDTSLNVVLAGGEPERAPAAPTPMPADEPSALGLTPRVLLELQEGRVLDQSITDLTPSGSLAVAMLLIERPHTDATPEQVAADLRAWSRVQRKLMRVVAEAQSDSGEQGDGA